MSFLALLLLVVGAACKPSGRIREYSMASLLRTSHANSFDLIDEPERVAGYFKLNRTKVTDFTA